MNYDTMSVHELVNLLVDIDSPAMQRVGIEEVPAIESALRKAVIREASAGVVRLRMSDGDSCWRGFRGEDHEEDLPDGYYDLIPRDTP